MNLRERATSSAFWSSLQGVVSQSLSFLIFIILARLLDPSAYGLIALSMVFITVLVTIAFFGMERAIVQSPSINEGEPEAAMVLSCSLGAALSIALFLCGSSLAEVLNTPELAGVLHWMAPIVMIRSTFVVPRALMVRGFEFRKLALRAILALVFGGAVGIYMALNGYGVWSLVGLELTKAVVSGITIWISSRWRPQFRSNTLPIARMRRRSINILGIDLLNQVDANADNLLIGSFLGTTSLGIYTVAYKVYRVVTDLVLGSFTSIGLPTLSRMQDSPAKLLQAFSQLTQLSAALTLPVFVLLALTAGQIVPIVFGAKWTDSIPILQILMIASCAQVIRGFNHSLLLATSNSRPAFLFSVANTVVNLLVFFVAVHWGLLVLATAFTVKSWLLVPLEFLLCRRCISLPVLPHFRALGGHCLAITGLVSAVLGYRMIDSQPPVLVNLAIEVILGSTIYIAVLWASRRDLVIQLVSVAQELLFKPRQSGLSVITTVSDSDK